MIPNVAEIPVTVSGQTIEGKDLPVETQRLLQHVVDLSQKREELLFQLSQNDVALAAFRGALDDMLAPTPRTNEEKVA